MSGGCLSLLKRWMLVKKCFTAYWTYIYQTTWQHSSQIWYGGTKLVQDEVVLFFQRNTAACLYLSFLFVTNKNIVGNNHGTLSVMKHENDNTTSTGDKGKWNCNWNCEGWPLIFFLLIATLFFIANSDGYSLSFLNYPVSCKYLWLQHGVMM